MRKIIDITEATVKVFNRLALEEDRSTKNMIERQLEAMGKHGIPYIDLWNQCEAVTKQLQQISK
jgi:hypothetical protein